MQNFSSKSVFCIRIQTINGRLTINQLLKKNL
jgi:hypothetical protein